MCPESCVPGDTQLQPQKTGITGPAQKGPRVVKAAAPHTGCGFLRWQKGTKRGNDVEGHGNAGWAWLKSSENVT